RKRKSKRLSPPRTPLRLRRPLKQSHLRKEPAMLPPAKKDRRKNNRLYYHSSSNGKPLRGVMNRGVFFAMEITDSFYVGYISKSRGLKGEVQVFFEYDEYDALDLDVLFVEIDHKLVPFFVQHIALHPNRTAYVMFEDIDHIDKAQRLVRKKIYLPNSKKPVRDPDDFRITDLQGYTAVDRTYG